MYTERFKDHLVSEVRGIKEQGLYKHERVIYSKQQPGLSTVKGKVVNFCANNYLGLSSDPRLAAAAKRVLDERGYGLSSVRFICGTQDLHKELETRISRFLGTEDTILYSSCFDANGGLFETLLKEEDAVVSDSLNHASIIDGIRLCKAKRFVYKNGDMADLDGKLAEAKASGARHVMIATDGVFSMDGYIAKLGEICGLAEKHGALVMVDDSHATGFVGPTGRGTIEYCGVLGRVDIVTSTFGKALGGASGGFTSGRREIIELLRQRSRPYLFSNSLAPVIAGTTLEVLNIVETSRDLLVRLRENTAFLRESLSRSGFQLREGDHPIIPVMLGDAKLAMTMADALLEKGIYVIGFSYPVVPMGAARIRLQVSAAHTREDLDLCIRGFEEAGKALGVI